MKKKILLVLLIILLILFMLLIGFRFWYLKYSVNSNSGITESIIKKSPELIPLNTIDACKDNTDCSFVGTNIYSELKFDFDNDEMQKWIQEINQETDKYYQESINSTLDDELCMDVKNIYNYKIITSSYYENYIDSNYVSLSVKRVTSNLCTEKSTSMPVKVFLYSRDKNLEINQEQLKEELNLSEEIIKDQIKKNIETMISNVPNDFDYSNYTLYYDSTGCLLAEYYLPLKDRYYSTTIVF